MRRRGGVREPEDDVAVGYGGVGNVALQSVDHPFALRRVKVDTRLHARRIGADVLLGDTDRANGAAVDYGREEPVAQRGVGVAM